jgi:hypothetical protein
VINKVGVLLLNAAPTAVDVTCGVDPVLSACDEATITAAYNAWAAE